MATDPHQEKKLHDALYSGRKIEAIKLYREAHNCGLKEAKEQVEALEARLRKENAGQFEKAEVKGGCLGLLVLSAVLAVVLLAAIH